MNTVVSVPIALLMAAAFCAGTPRETNIMTSTENPAAQDAPQAFTMRPLTIADAKSIDGIKLVERQGQLTLLFSTEASTEGRYELVIHAAPLSEIARVTEVARINRMLPVAPRWDARPVGNGFEILYEMAGGAIDAILFQDTQGNTKRVSVEHPFESFSRPHFIRGGQDTGPSDVGAIADLKKVVVFPAGTTRPVKYDALVEGADGVVGGTTDRWVVAKNAVSGATLFDTLPGRLTLSRVGGRDALGSTVPDVLVYEFDAAPVPNDVLVFATSKPALLILGRRPDRPYRLTAEDRNSLLQLWRPTILVTSQFVHLAAIARPGTDQAVVLHGAVPISVLGP